MPDGHWLWDEEPDSLTKYPGDVSKQIDWSPGWYFPGGHEVVVDPSGLAIWPGGGASHPDDPDSDWNCPGGHGVGSVAPSKSTKNPGSEGVQEPCPGSDEYVPFWHWFCDIEPSSD